MLSVMVIFGVLTILSGAAVVFSRNPLNSALWLVLTLFLIAVHYALLGAHFIAAIQVFVYAGAIMVLVIFVIMLLGSEAQAAEPWSPKKMIGALLGAGAFFVLIGGAIAGAKLAPPRLTGPADGTTAGVGRALFENFVYPFEIVSLLVLAAIIGAVVLGLEAKRPLQPGRGLAAMRRKMESLEK